MFNNFSFICILILIKCLLIPSCKCANEFPNSIKFYKELVAEFNKKGISIYTNSYFQIILNMICLKIWKVIFFILKKLRLTSFRNWGRDPNTFRKIVSNNVQCFVSTYQVRINYNYCKDTGTIQNQRQQFVVNLFKLILHSDCNSVKCEVKINAFLGSLCLCR